MSLEGVETASVDLKKKTADVSMKPGVVLKNDIVAAALKKNGGFKVTGILEKKPVAKKAESNLVKVGLSGMT